MMSKNICGSTPAFSTSANASPRLSIIVASRKLRATFTALALGASAATLNQRRPSTLNNGSQRAIADGAPAAITSSSPRAANSGRPNTGADTYCVPCPRCSASSRCPRRRLTDAMFKWIAVAGSFCTRPLVIHTASTDASSASMVMTTSAASVSSGERATTAPRAAKASVAARVRFHTTRGYPLSINRDAMPRPIWPRPINPIFICVIVHAPSGLFRWTGLCRKRAHCDSARETCTKRALQFVQVFSGGGRCEKNNVAAGGYGIRPVVA